MPQEEDMSQLLRDRAADLINFANACIYPAERETLLTLSECYQEEADRLAREGKPAADYHSGQLDRLFRNLLDAPASEFHE